MPLPQETNGTKGFILKNSTIYEIVKFNDKSDIDLPTTAPNRGEGLLQTPTALYYEQQVYFGPGSPGNAKIVHTENGSWLNLRTSDPFTGENPYQDPMLQNPNQQPATSTIAKQMSVPHGNSILALGSFNAPAAGVPTLSPTEPYPYLPTPTTGLDLSAYDAVLDNQDSYQNPIPAWTRDPFEPLNIGVKLIPNITHSMNWQVTTAPVSTDPPAAGGTLNIPFEERSAEVTDYSAIYWLLSTDGGTQYNYLAYAQAITLKIKINDTNYSFPHLTSNLVTRDKT